MEKELHHFTLCGLDNVYLTNGYTIEPDEGYGEGVSYHDVDGLHKAIALSIIENSTYLSPKEFKFLRIELGATQQYLANLFGKDAQAVARWEKGKCDIPVLADRNLRSLYLENVEKGYKLTEMLESLAERDDSSPSEYHLKYSKPRGKTPAKWQMKHAA